ncbi:MAG: OST-HTH/LOTUS domain-containing protein, partial [Campylobacterales bacterium]
VSSDSDFTKLAARLREGGMVVYGFGEKKTPNPFVVACDKFIYTEVLRYQEEQSEHKISKMNTQELKRDTRLVNLLRSATESSSDESGWAHLGAVGSNIIKQAPEFDARNYGYEKLSELVSATKLFDVDEFFDDKLGLKKSIYIRDKRKLNSKS